MRRSIRAIGVTCEYVLYDYLIHFPYFAVRTLLSPALYLFGFGLGVGALTQAGESAYFEYIFPGVLMISVMQASYTHFSTEIWISRQVDKYLELLMMVAPIYPLEAVAGYLIAGTLISLFAAGCFVLMAMLVVPGLTISLGWLLGFTVGLGIFFVSLGIISGVIHTDPHIFSATNTLIILPLSFLCGVFFPLDVFPQAIRFLLELIPLTQAVEGMRSNAPFLHCLYVWSLAVITAVIAAGVFKRKIVS
ncbi:putative ABC-2-like transporter, permease protein [Thermacetogenium phaeum DSM 12270]|uniref:Transport permease protein n=1 Tax=Thermacetogenium phaeum (strain ATCC BAA-254 / DSM 26808 / PB) TaxID=1089553 RepID=K4LL37_THEPS|nr:ABC transporter permease [Thermacetogenium phaeum]AFV12695.1 putative ABC-2-like transporter, permease protein [Thermacetogenium phaeum DSM 12270]